MARLEGAIALLIGVPFIAACALAAPIPKAAEEIRHVPVIGRWPALDAAQAIAPSDSVAAWQIRQAVQKGGGIEPAFAQVKLPAGKAYQYTDHAFGFIAATTDTTEDILPIVDAGRISPQGALKGATLKITLDRLRVFEYPGGGTHQVLFDFRAEHQATDEESQSLHFNQTYRALQGAGAGISGYPVFVGLRAGSEGVDFACTTTNISNDGDEKFLSFLNSDTFTKGLHLLNGLNPAVPVVTGFATGIATGVAQSHRNIPVQSFYLGLDFSTDVTHAKLKEGSYVAIQVPQRAAWDWSQWVFSRAQGEIVSKTNHAVGVPLNYIVFAVSKM